MSPLPPLPPAPAPTAPRSAIDAWRRTRQRRLRPEAKPIAQAAPHCAWIGAMERADALPSANHAQPPSRGTTVAALAPAFDGQDAWSPPGSLHQVRCIRFAASAEGLSTRDDSERRSKTLNHRV